MADTYRTNDNLQAVRERVHELAALRGGAFRRSDLPEWGIAAEVLPAMLRRNWWVRLHHGVYVDARLLATPADSVERHVLNCAASLRALPGLAHAFASSASAIHGLSMQRGLITRVQLVRAVDSDGRALTRRVTSKTSLDPARMRSHNVPPEQLTEIGGIPTVSRALAAISTAAMSRRDWALVTLDADAWQRPAALVDLPQLAAEWSHLRGIGVVRSILPLVRCGAQTPLESLSRLRLIECALPEPELQVAFYDESGLIGYADMFWPELGVIGEADGQGKYQSREDLIKEKAREDRLRALGYIVVRWTWNEIMTNPQAVAARIRRASMIARRRAG